MPRFSIVQDECRQTPTLYDFFFETPTVRPRRPVVFVCWPRTRRLPTKTDQRIYQHGLYGGAGTSLKVVQTLEISVVPLHFCWALQVQLVVLLLSMDSTESRIEQYTKFGQLIIRQIVEIIATGCHLLKLKCTKFDSWCPFVS